MLPPTGAPQFPLAPPHNAGPAGGGDSVEILNAMLQLATLYRSGEADQQDKLAMERVSTLVQQLLAKDEADRRAAAPAPFPGR